MTQRLPELVEQFCQYQRKQLGKTEDGVQTYRWILGTLLSFVRGETGRLGRLQDVTEEMVQG